MSQMTKNELTGPHARPSSDATQIEQQRAVAQVQGALIVARQSPRDTIAARARMEEACALSILAEHAFFRYSRGGSQITGPSIHLATELARCWGNIDYGISELRRDDENGVSEMLAHAWDLETNTRVVNSFIVPHKRDKRGGPEALVDMRDIYENNANQGARRLRECIFRTLPKSYIEEAKDICRQTLEHGGGEPIEKRRANLLEAFAGMHVTRKQIETKMGRAADRLSAYDLGVLRVVYQSLRRGETTIADEFPTDDGDEVAAALSAPRREPTNEAAAPPAEETAPEPSEAPLWQLVDEFGEVVPNEDGAELHDAETWCALYVARLNEVNAFGTEEEAKSLLVNNGAAFQAIRESGHAPDGVKTVADMIAKVTTTPAAAE